MQYQSVVSERGTAAPFPAFTGERAYMVPFFQRDGLPSELARWQPLVDSMLVDIETGLPIYIMIDQKRVSAGEYHRRPGVHIDGYWGGNAWSPISAHSSHRPAPTSPRHRPAPTPRHTSGAGDWATAAFDEKEAIILASNVAACGAYEGEFDGPIGDMGDCSTVQFENARGVMMEANRVYAGNVTMVHETFPCVEDCERTVVRLNVPGWSP